VPPLIIFKCSKCNTVRGSYSEAERCEESHLSAVSVTSLDYMLGPYPVRVVLTFPDGIEREYEARE